MGVVVAMFVVFLLVVGLLVYSIFSIQYQTEQEWDEEMMIEDDEDDQDG